MRERDGDGGCRPSWRARLSAVALRVSRRAGASRGRSLATLERLCGGLRPRLGVVGGSVRCGLVTARVGPSRPTQAGWAEVAALRRFQTTERTCPRRGPTAPTTVERGPVTVLGPTRGLGATATGRDGCRFVMGGRRVRRVVGGRKRGFTFGLPLGTGGGAPRFSVISRRVATVAVSTAP